MKLIWKLVKFCILIAVLGFIFQNFAAKSLLSFYLGQTLGTKVTVANVRIDFVNTQMKFEGLKINNPMVFPEGLLASIPKLFIDWEVSSLWQGRLNFATIELNVEELRVIKVPGYGLNLYNLKVFQQGSASTGKSEPSGESAPARKMPDFHIQNLVLTLGQATFTDLSGANPVQKSYHLRVDHAVYRNVEGMRGISEVVIWETLKRMGLGALSGAFDGMADQGRGFLGGILDKITGKT